MATYSNTAREVEMPNGDVVVIHNAPTGGANTTSNIKKFKYDDNGHVTESTAANATDLNLSSYSTPTTGTTDIGTSDTVQTAIGKLDHQSHIDQSNILYGLQTGVKNIIRLNPGTYTNNVATFTVNNDGEVIVNSGSAGTSAITIGEFELPAGDYVYWYDNTASIGKCDVRLMNGSTRLSGAFTLSSAATIHADVYSYAVNSNVSIKPMLCTAGAWAQEPNVYRKPALPNYDLTRLEAQDRAALAEEIDAGAKNKLDCNVSTLIPLNTYGSWSGSTYSINSGTTSFVVNSNLTITASKSDTGTARSMTFANYTDGSVLNGMVISGGTSNVTIIVQKNGGNYETYATSEGSGALISGIAANTAVRIVASIASAVTCSNVVIKPMLATKAAFGVSSKFVPYRPNYDLVVRRAGSTATVPYTSIAAETWERVSDLSFDVLSGETVCITAGAVPNNTNVTGIQIVYGSTANTNIIAINDSSTTTGMLSLNVTGVFKNRNSYNGIVSVFVKYAAANKENYVTIDYSRK